MPAVLYLLALAVFAQGTSEFVLAGLLPGIANDFDVPIGRAGLLTSAFAVGMVVGAPAMAVLARRLSPRWSLTGFLAVFTLAHAAGAVTGDFAVLMATRVVAAAANAGFLAVALANVNLLVPEHRRARALAVILSGTTLALVAGVPAGAFVGSALGWRATLWGIAGLCLPALVAVAVATPARAATEAVRARVRTELAVLRRAPLQRALALAVLVNGATFAVFTYLADTATGAAGIGEGTVPALLVVFGVGAYGGVTVAGRLADAHWRRLLAAGGPPLVLGWAVLVVAVHSAPALWALAFTQGLLSFLVGSTLIARVMATSGDAPTLGGSFATVALNVGAVVGPVGGGLAIGTLGPRGPSVVATALSLVALILFPRRARAPSAAE